MATLLSDPLLDEAQAAELLGISARTLQRWRRTDAGPVFVRLGGSVRYPRLGLERFAQAGLEARRERLDLKRETSR